MPKTDGKKKEYRVFLDPELAEEVDSLAEGDMYSSHSEVLRYIVRDWYRRKEKEK